MTKINKIQAYLLVFPVLIIAYTANQLLFFINSANAKAMICEVRSSRDGRSVNVFYYMCYKTVGGKDVKTRAPRYINYYLDDTLSVVYKKELPRWSRVNDFHSLWIRPLLFYLIPLGVMLGLVTGIFYGNKYILISWRPLRIRLSNEREWRQPLVRY